MNRTEIKITTPSQKKQQPKLFHIQIHLKIKNFPALRKQDSKAPFQEETGVFFSIQSTGSDTFTDFLGHKESL